MSMETCASARAVADDDEASTDTTRQPTPLPMLTRSMVRMQQSQQDEPVEIPTDVLLHASDAPTPIIGGTRTAFLNSALCEGHDIASHPECVDRVRVVRQRIAADFPSVLEIQEIAPITRQRLLLFHTPKHVDAMSNIFASVKSASENTRKKSESKVHHIDEDTAIAVGTEVAALTAAGSVCDAIDLVMRNDDEDGENGENSSTMRITNAFCGVRPPGHHAEPHRAMGFCLFNNVGIGACYLLDAFPDVIERVSIVDFDVHHGNGTQAKFASEDYPNVQYISTHQAPFYPHTGNVHERGVHSNILNVPLRARTDSVAFRSAFESRVLPAMHAFKPDFILISAGFDAHAQDPLAELALESDDYYWMTQQIVDVAWKHAAGRVVSVLEGGYHLDALAESAAAHMRALIEGAVAPNQRVVEEQQQDHHAIEELAFAFESSVTVTSETPHKVSILPLPCAVALIRSGAASYGALQRQGQAAGAQIAVARHAARAVQTEIQPQGVQEEESNANDQQILIPLASRLSWHAYHSRSPALATQRPTPVPALRHNRNTSLVAALGLFILHPRACALSPNK